MSLLHIHKTCSIHRWQFIFIQLFIDEIPKTFGNNASMLCSKEIPVSTRISCVVSCCLFCVHIIFHTNHNHIHCLSFEHWTWIDWPFFATDIIVCLICLVFLYAMCVGVFISFQTMRIPRKYAHTRQFINHESNFQFISHAPNRIIFQLLSAKILFNYRIINFLCVFSDHFSMLLFFCSHRN